MYNVSQVTHSFRQCYLLHREGMDEPSTERLNYFIQALYTVQRKLSHKTNAVHNA